MKLALFDFDGTLTNKDSMLDFIVFTVGKTRFFMGLVLLSPILLAFLAKLISSTVAKQCLLRFFFAGWTESDFNLAGKRYCQQRIDRIVRACARKKLLWHQGQGHTVVIVSASAENWLQPWCDRHGIQLLASQLEIKDGQMTGHLSSLNCHGVEKVVRIKRLFDLPKVDYIYAYGDTPGDKPMLMLADEPYYRCFK